MNTKPLTQAQYDAAMDALDMFGYLMSASERGTEAATLKARLEAGKKLAA